MMWWKLFDAPFPDASSIVPAAAQEQAAAHVRSYWKSRGWQLALGEWVVWGASIYQGEVVASPYLGFALLISVAYLIGLLEVQVFWLVGTLLLFGLQGVLMSGLGAVTALSFMVPYTIAGMILSERPRVVVQVLSVSAFWGSLLYEVVPFLPQLETANYILVSFNVLIAAYTFQTLRFLNNIAVEINGLYVADEVRMQSHQFLARVSHELRTPLNSMLGFGKLLRRAPLNPRHEQYLAQVIEEGEQLNRLVSDLLDSAHLSTGKLTLVKEDCDINAICQAVVDEHRPALADAVHLKADLNANCPNIHADPIRLRQVVGNLVSNAVKHTLDGSITVKTRSSNNQVQIEISDTGSGISDEQQKLIFVPFVQLDQRKTGVGLGLDIALQLVRLHGGDIKLSSIPGSGSSFTVELPIR
jgi:signal transduction histidine kinase